jgi:hypothetical protein
MLLPRRSEIDQHAIEGQLRCAVGSMHTNLLDPLISVVLHKSRRKLRGRPLDHQIQIRQRSPWISVLIVQQGITHSAAHEG